MLTGQACFESSSLQRNFRLTYCVCVFTAYLVVVLLISTHLPAIFISQIRQHSHSRNCLAAASVRTNTVERPSFSTNQTNKALDFQLVSAFTAKIAVYAETPVRFNMLGIVTDDSD